MQKYNNYSNPPNFPHPDAQPSAPQNALIRLVVFFATIPHLYSPLPTDTYKKITP